MEEDTGKLLHRLIEGEEVSLIDFNRSGVPLAEIVTEPDIRSAQEAKETAKKIHQIVRALDVSDADMEKGSMRLEANISLMAGPAARHPSPTSSSASWRTAGARPGARFASPAIKLPNYKVEIKNINSFRFLEKAINAEIERQKKILHFGKKVQQQTFGWDTEKQELNPQRVKEEAADYRYFPEPDIPPIRLTDRWISDIRNKISDLPEEVYQGLVDDGVADAAAKVIAGDKRLTVVMEEIIKKIKTNKDREKTGKRIELNIKNFGNWVLHHQEDVRTKSAEELVALFNQEKAGMVSDAGQLEAWVSESIKNNPQAVADFKAGKQQAVGFLIGQVQKLAKGKAEIQIVKKLLVNKLIYAG